ncbi:MAG: phosphosulfolactate synthase [Bacteroidales bacterium]
MNFTLPFLPERSNKPRNIGLAMVMDKGLSLRQAEDLVETSGHLIDYIKLGFGTSIAYNGLEKKIDFYKKNNIKVYFGGTLFEAFVIRNLFEDYLKLIDKFNLCTVEVSDGSMTMDHTIKCEYISRLAKNFNVLSEVGSKNADILIPTEVWIEQMLNELEAGANKIICEARESGTVGIFDKSGKANTNLIESISQKVDLDHIIWEAPLKGQQVWFIKNFGANVNLGNISPEEIVPLETLRLGLRGDTFQEFIPEHLK